MAAALGGARRRRSTTLTDSSTARSPLWVRRLAANPSAAIIGTILAAAVIAATGRHQSAWTTFAATAVTLVVFWLTHVYAQALGQHLRAGGHPVMELSVIMGHELVVIEGGLPPLALLALGALRLLDEALAITLALWVAVAALFGWGALAGHRQGRGLVGSLVSGLIGGVLGVVVVVLEALLH